MYDFAILVGRFQPYHTAHEYLLNEAFNQAKQVVLVLGSHNKSRSIKNPFSSEEREKMIRLTLSSDHSKRIQFIKIADKLYNDNIWITELQEKISSITNGSESIALIGHDFDRSSFYLKLFPQWTFLPQKNIDKCPHATKLRELYFTHDLDYKDYVHQNIFNFMELFKNTQTFKVLKEEFNFITEYRANWVGAPFDPVFTTVDSVVIKSGHVLVTSRKGNLGRGLIALPGGFVGQHDRIKDATLKTLKSETGIKLSKEELEQNIVETTVFDHPDRSLRGRTITHATFINLKSGPLPQVKGGEENDRAWWMPLSEFLSSEEKFFEDHYSIICSYIFRS